MARKIIVSLSLFMLCLTVQAQQNELVFTPEEQTVIELSDKKWQWMSEKNTDNLSQLFHDNSQFVLMGGYWGKATYLMDNGKWKLISLVFTKTLGE